MTFPSLGAFIATFVCLAVAGLITFASVVTHKERRLARLKRGFREGPEQRHQPVCVRTRWGFYGGPSGWRPMDASEPDDGPLIAEHEEYGNE